MNTEFDLRERFHLYLLRALAPRLAGRRYAVKGGACLRFFHRSPRLSEDMDIDVDPKLPVKTLQNNVEAALKNHSLLAGLRDQGLESIDATQPKQTETTQRWKIMLGLRGGNRLSTKLEFSRRTSDIPAKQATPSPELLRASYMAPFAVSHYDATTMVSQKVHALASPTRTAARDLFDLHHLLTQTTINAALLKSAPAKLPLSQAIEKINLFDYADFQNQVFPYLAPGIQPLYQDSEAYESLRREVNQHLRGFLP